ncbi:MAG: hypothetical protein K0Q76_2719 [Panacagrimonas sp.]|jgi:hypothetical protein|nr:hypothetical protein [Panacagrimonas sp.]
MIQSVRFGDGVDVSQTDGVARLPTPSPHAIETAWGEGANQSRSMIVTLATPPPSHIVCRP